MQQDEVLQGKARKGQTNYHLVDVAAAHDGLAEVLESICDAVRLERPNDEKLAEGGLLAPLARHLRFLTRLQPAPALPLL